ncbi:hypothetical protein [Desulfatibacillum aliphaticivorans]|uniref:hypothetical protein n=1 Tax=Desulfatibacillum aliphaticivorans TaxID=218208 RepID=UPI0003FFA31E|nr:hypothetical protein [Desulfatibacillum aliphaticivorans]
MDEKNAAWVHSISKKVDPIYEIVNRLTGWKVVFVFWKITCTQCPFFKTEPDWSDLVRLFDMEILPVMDWLFRNLSPAGEDFKWAVETYPCLYKGENE